MKDKHVRLRRADNVPQLLRAKKAITAKECMVLKESLSTNPLLLMILLLTVSKAPYMLPQNSLAVKFSLAAHVPSSLGSPIVPGSTAHRVHPGIYIRKAPKRICQRRLSASRSGKWDLLTKLASTAVTRKLGDGKKPEVVYLTAERYPNSWKSAFIISRRRSGCTWVFKPSGLPCEEKMLFYVSRTKRLWMIRDLQWNISYSGDLQLRSRLIIYSSYRIAPKGYQRDEELVGSKYTLIMAYRAVTDCHSTKHYSSIRLVSIFVPRRTPGGAMTDASQIIRSDVQVLEVLLDVHGSHQRTRKSTPKLWQIKQNPEQDAVECLPLHKPSASSEVDDRREPCMVLRPQNGSLAGVACFSTSWHPHVVKAQHSKAGIALMYSASTTKFYQAHGSVQRSNGSEDL
ncbi:uncharacterized protein MYCFIDRAFT_173190 [Pseudocercospora fijiensis CIRAD86]|uniref:Uncharacterized protein n=1 Tax=Pseudocercospora fijiensis (strain CIRAD86) TaxID=383855 RepID=M3B467_PSEFD|nr:uncharacterized protein MYCFIDRAFT_173190 [Pseudocercospora fijiensis CIRAD86]EME84147.1 hypothetical protein MYCFIDRAFT_173190 [Pseudocercospora fijiensis CIRAD86]